MTLFSYEIFDAVARQGSFNKAAQQLHLTPSAISHAIAVMEEELGFALFNRGKNGVSMTSYGASLYPSIRDVLNSDEALKQSIARLNGLEKGKVKLGVFNSVCASLLPGLLKSFAAHYPQIEIEVYQGTYDDVKEWLRTGQVDIAFLSSTCREEFNLTELFREPLLCIVPQDWPDAGKTLGSLHFWQATGATVVAIARADALTVSPGPYAELRSEDRILFVGDQEAREAVARFFSKTETT